MRKWKEFVGSTIASGFSVKEVIGMVNIWRCFKVKSLPFHFVFKLRDITVHFHVDGNNPVERQTGVREMGQQRPKSRRGKDWVGRR